MIAILSALCTIASGGPSTIVVAERKPLAVMISVPTERAGRASSSTILSTIGEALKEHTDLDPRELDSVWMKECRGLLSCLSDRIYAESIGAHLLLVISMLTSESGADVLSAVLLDLDKAASVVARAKQAHVTDAMQVEADLTQSAVLDGPRTQTVREEDEMRAFIQDLVAVHHRAHFERLGHFHPYGELVLHASLAGPAIRIDGNTVGTLQTGETRLMLVAGKRTLLVEHPDFEPYSKVVDVAKDGSTELSVELVSRSGSPHLLRPIIFWGGASAAAVGGGMMLLSAVTTKSNKPKVCFHQDDVSGCDTGLRFSSPLIPVGYSMAATGVVWMLSRLAFGDSDRAPIAEVLIGLGAGAAALTLSLALQGSDPDR